MQYMSALILQIINVSSLDSSMWHDSKDISSGYFKKLLAVCFFFIILDKGLFGLINRVSVIKAAGSQ